MKFKRNFFLSFLSFLFVSAFLLAGCSNLLNEEGMNEKTSSEAYETYITLNLGSESNRTALPDVELDNLTSIVLYYQDKDDSELEWIGIWEDSSELKKAVIPFKTGDFEFTLVAMCNQIYFTDTKEVTITSGRNNLSFTPKLMTLLSDSSGKGSLSVSLSFVSDNVETVTCGLYTLEKAKVPGFSDEDLIITSGGKVSYSKEDIPSGNYLVIFNFYADSEKTRLLGSYYEYASVANGLISKSDCVLEDLDSLYTISLNLNSGSLSGNYTLPGTYTRRMNTISLPSPSKDEVTRDGYLFDGWYDNSYLEGSSVTEIPSGSSGNKEFYAKWVRKPVITFKANNGTSATKTQELVPGEETKLKTIEELNFENGENRFLRWEYSSADSTGEYDDGAFITLYDDITLKAVWGVSSIDPSDKEKDTDGDGLTDYDELDKYKTDPSSKDTDGDGWSDYEELHGLYVEATNTFNPLIADTPQLEVKMVDKPKISYLYSVSVTESDAVTVTENDGYVSSISSTEGNTKTHTETHGWGLDVTESYSWAGASPGFTLTGKESYTGSVANGDSYTYSKNASESWSKSWSNGKSTTKSNGRNVSGGKVKIPIRFKNPSNIAYTVTNVTVALYRIPVNSQEGRIYVSNLSLSDPGSFTILPGAESGLYFLSTDLSIEGTENLLKYSRGFDIEVSGYKITLQKNGSFANDFTEALTQVKAKTAAVYIDWGCGSGKNPCTYNVSVKNLYNTGATEISALYDKPDLEYIFQNMLNYKKGRDFTLNANGCLESVYGVANKENNKKGAWFICHKYTENGIRKGKLYARYTSPLSQAEYNWKLSDIKLSAGDEVSIIYSVDEDDDMVPLNEELIFGTSDNDADSDDDGLTDYEEIYGWYKTHLDSKYSDSNKVCSNPVLKDTDGDDLLDYSKDSTLSDSDPVFPKQKNDASLSHVRLKTSENGSWVNLASGSSTDYEYSGNAFEYVWLDIQPKLSFAKVEYSKEMNGAYFDFTEATKIPLAIGNNNIYVKCTAPDGQTAKIYTIKISSSFISMSGFSVKGYEGGKVSLSWNSYADTRAQEANKGGYILYGKKASTVKKNLTRSDIANANDTKDTCKDKDEFYLKLNDASLSQGLYSLNLQSDTNYSLILFAYSGSNSDDSFKSDELDSKSFKTEKDRYGTFTFYAHYMENKKSRDGGYSPEYYVTCTSSDSRIAMGDLTISNTNAPKFRVGKDDFYCFGEKIVHQDSCPPVGDSGCTKKLSGTFDRTRSFSFTASFTFKERDYSSPDDNLGTVTITFTYDPSRDVWTAKWTNVGNSSPKTINVPWSSSIQEECIDCDNSDDGCVGLFFGLRWWKD